GLLVSGKSLRRLLLSRENLLPKLCNSCAHVRVGQDRFYRGVELSEYLLRCPFGQPKADPYRSVEPWQSGLIHRWNVRRNGQPCLACDRIGFDVAGANLLQEVGHGFHLQIDMTG